MINLGTSDERIKNLIKKKYEKNCIVVDDLWTLSLEKCKNSNLQFCLICEELIFSKEAKDLVEFYSKKTECFAVSKKVFERIASKDNLAGIVLYTKIDELNLSDFANFDRVLVCDGIEISGNIGTIFRTADATKIDAIIFTNLKAKVFDEKVVHSSRGMIFQVPFVILDFDDTVELLKQNNITPVVCEPEQGIDYKSFDYNKKLAFVFGSERFGSDKRWFDQKETAFLKIEMGGVMTSLNVSVAASLVMYESFYSLKKIRKE